MTVRIVGLALLLLLLAGVTLLTLPGPLPAAALAAAPEGPGNPSIDLLVASGEAGQVSTTTAYTAISGRTAPAAAVHLRVLRGQAVVAEETTAADASGATAGAYAFRPGPQSCSTQGTWSPTAQTPGAVWSFQPGDVVEVTAQPPTGPRLTATTTVAPLTAYLDPAADLLSGSTAAGYLVSVELTQPRLAARCDADVDKLAVRPTLDGSFTVRWGGAIDVDSAASAAICARDANGNGPCLTVPAFHITLAPSRLDPRSLTLSGQVKPGASFYVNVVRDGITLLQGGRQASADGYVFWNFGSAAQVGDVVQLASDGVFLERRVEPLSADLDPVTDRFHAFTAPGAQLAAVFTRRGPSAGSACAARSQCVSLASPTGESAGPAPLDLGGGDYVELTAYDAAGNAQRAGPFNAVSLAANLTGSYVTGYWRAALQGLEVRLFAADGRLKATGSAYSDAADALIYGGPLPAPIIPGDRIEVVELAVPPPPPPAPGVPAPTASTPTGAFTRTMTVADLTARLDTAGGAVTGHSPGGRVVAVVQAGTRCPQIDAATELLACRDEGLPAGPYTLHFSGVGLQAGDRADVYAADDQGNYTAAYSTAFEVRFGLDSYFFYGATPGVGEQVTGRLLRGGQVVATCASAPLTGSGPFNTAYSCNWMPYATVRPGDVIEVQTSAGDAATLQAPDLAPVGKAAPPRFEGQWLPGQLVGAHLWQSVRYATAGASLPTAYGTLSSGMQTAQADAAGRYTLWFGGLRRSVSPSWQLAACLPVKTTGACVEYDLLACYPGGHTVSVHRPTTGGVITDAFEPDNAAEIASTYAGPQGHTFNTPGDADWVRFEVPAAHAGRVAYRIGTSDLPIGAAQDITLWRGEPPALALERAWRAVSAEGEPVTLFWTPPAAGTYMLRLLRPAGLSPITCADTYTLRIDPQPNPGYLPVLGR